MNKKGQTLLTFVLLIPTFLIFIAFVIDTGYLLKENTKLNNLTKTVLKETAKYYNTQDYEEKIKKLYEVNGVLTENINLKTNENSAIIQINNNIPSIFGNLIGIKEYEIKTSFKITINEEEIKIEKE